MAINIVLLVINIMKVMKVQAVMYQLMKINDKPAKYNVIV